MGSVSLSLRWLRSRCTDVRSVAVGAVPSGLADRLTLNPAFILLILASIASSAFSGSAFTLDEAIEYALEHNPDLLRTREQVNGAKGMVMEARSGFLPHFELGASYTRQFELPTLTIAGADGPAVEVPLGYENNYSAGISVTQSLWSWGRVLNAYRIADLGLDAVRYDVEEMESAVRYEVARAFYGLIVAHEFEKVARDALGQAERHFGVVETREREGLASRFDLLRAQVQVANAKPPVIRAANAVDLAEQQLKLVLGIDLATQIEVQGELVVGPAEVDLVEAIEQALAMRPALESLRRRRSIAARALSIAQAQNKPTFFASAAYVYQRPFYFSEDWGRDIRATVGVTIPIFDGFRTRGAVARAKSSLRDLELSLTVLEDGVELEVRTAYLRLMEAQETLASQQETVGQAEESLRIAEVRFRNGMATSLEVMDTQLALTQARTNYLGAVSDFLIARASLVRAVGRDMWGSEGIGEGAVGEDS
ncbi:hypothetical protein AMJ39_07400 [candidate division TA06 bacterium DG_24]|uniref:TolC family protein n=3 Tax=Bacteria division TA06 TaxID=1156500 RepID=A0A0S8JJW7_UNCT6|nr:MAG: hypothetical protein AMJ39_07400 [candidate division TA06 bacterium DG_24]KPK67728.1 MAG: hypothetical protein AMJ82_10010 [candidate division TA06 bacterium SM23_40]KPL10068.1 MAG: hypothetical protein AMJ71_04590 [candidate division TA06 bacterium SM1_40]